MVLPGSDSPSKSHKRSVSDSACNMPFHKKQEGDSRYPLRNQGSSAREADPKPEAVELPKHTSQNSNKVDDMDGSGEKVSAKAVINVPEKPVASASLAEHPKGNVASVTTDENAADSVKIEASNASETSAEGKATSNGPLTSAHVAPGSGARAGTALAYIAPAITAPAASTPVTAAPVLRAITARASTVLTAAPLPTPPNDQSSQDDAGSHTPVQSYGSIEIPDISFDPVAMAVDYWTRPGPGGHHVEAPKLPGFGRWQIPLPPNMNAALHVRSQEGLLFHYLGVLVIVGRDRPALKITLYPSQKYQELFTSFVIEDHIAKKWKAWKLIFDWVQHLEQRGQSPANLPIDIVTFIRNRLHAEGRMATESAVHAIERRQREGALFAGATYWQLPRPILPQNRPGNMHPNVPNNRPTNKPANKPAAMPPNNAQDQAARTMAQTSQNQVAQKPSLTTPSLTKPVLPKPEPADDDEPMPLQNAEPNVAGQKKRRVVIDLLSDSEKEEPKPKRARQKK